MTLAMVGSAAEGTAAAKTAAPIANALAAVAAALLAAAWTAAAIRRAGGGEENPWTEARQRAIRPVPEEFSAKSSRAAEGGAVRGMTIEHYGRGAIGPGGAERAPLIFRMRAGEARGEGEVIRLKGVDLFYLVGEGAGTGRPRTAPKGSGAGDSGAILDTPPGSRLVVLAPRGSYFPAKCVGMAEGPAEIKAIRQPDDFVLWSISAEKLYWKYWEDDRRKQHHMFLFTCDPEGAAGDCLVSGDFRGDDTAGRPGGIRISARGMIFEGVSRAGGRQPGFERLHLVFGSDVSAAFEDREERRTGAGGAGQMAGTAASTRIRCAGPCEIELEERPGPEDAGKLRRVKFFESVECLRMGSGRLGGSSGAETGGKPGGERPGERPAGMEYADRIACGCLSLEYAPEDPWNRPRRAIAERGVVYEGRPTASKGGASGGGDGAVRMEGERLVLDEEAGKIEISGTPARVADARGQFEAPRIVCDRSDGTIIAPAGGRKRLILKSQTGRTEGGADGAGPEATAWTSGEARRVEAGGR
ncbi:MAG: hypothetical protein N3A38_04775 [Planctomycetota bacterium]|nr:hypothetical protein [Planctomycetota bacterium]